MALAKGIGSGFPMGACLATTKASVGMTKGKHGSTFGGNPLAISVGKAVIKEITSEGFLKKTDIIARFFWNELIKLKNDYKEIVDLRGAGLMLGIKTKMENTVFCDLLSSKGLLTIPASDNIIRLTPPLTITKKEVHEALSIIKETLDEYSD